MRALKYDVYGLLDLGLKKGSWGSYSAFQEGGGIGGEVFFNGN
jgi:hypothetical protein